MKTFAEMTETEPNTVMIVDALNLAFRYKHSGERNFLASYVRTVESLKKSYKADKVIIACDSGSSSYRKNLLPSYKENRKDKFELQTEEEAQAFKDFFDDFNKVMEYYEKESNYPTFRFNKTEADDIAAYIIKRRKSFGISTAWLISSDRDWDLLVVPGVNRFSYVTRKEVTNENWKDHYDCEPEDYISIKCLQGDTGDNVPGVPGIGPVKAAGLVKQYGTTYDIIDSLPISSKYKYIANLNAFGADNLYLNYKLMDLVEFCDEALGEENCAIINAKLRAYLC